MKRQSCALIGTSGARCARYRCAPCRAASSVSVGAWLMMPSWMSTRCGTACAYRLVRDHVDVLVEEQIVRIVHGMTVIAIHARSREPFARVIDPTHFAGLWRPAATPADRMADSLTALGRDLADYAAVVDGSQ